MKHDNSLFRHFGIIFTGTSSDADDVMRESVTETMTSSTITIKTQSTNPIYVTVTCVNQLNYRRSATVEPTRYLGKPPGSDDAAVHVIPEQLGVWQPSDNSQADRSTAAFSYGGFSDINNVEYYQYMLQYGATQTEWISVGKQVRIWLVSTNLCRTEQRTLKAKLSGYTFLNDMCVYYKYM